MPRGGKAEAAPKKWITPPPGKLVTPMPPLPEEPPGFFAPPPSNKSPPLVPVPDRDEDGQIWAMMEQGVSSGPPPKKAKRPQAKEPPSVLDSSPTPRTPKAQPPQAETQQEEAVAYPPEISGEIPIAQLVSYRKGSKTFKTNKGHDYKSPPMKKKETEDEWLCETPISVHNEYVTPKDTKEMRKEFMERRTAYNRVK